MPRLIMAFAIVTLIVTGMTFAEAGNQPSQINGVAANGNTTVVFAADNNSDLQMGLLTRWSRFAEVHPKVARQLGNKPALIEDPGYLRKHPELVKLFDENPKLLVAMKRDPGNFVANLPSSEE